MTNYQYPCSLVSQFSEEMYKNAGADEVLPLVMRSLDPDKVLAVQFLRAGKVHLTFDDPVTCSSILKNGLDLGDVTVQLSPADERMRSVHLRDLPVEVDHESVSSFFSAYGEVLSTDHCFFEEYPSLRNGNRIIKILLTEEIPCFVEINSCACRVWYPRQPAQCTVCRESGHRAPACPLSGRCRRCHQPGHVVRERTQAWGPQYSAPRTTVLQDPLMETEDAPVPNTDNSDAGSSEIAVSTVSTVTATAATVTTAAPVPTATATVTDTATTFTSAVPPTFGSSASTASVIVTDSIGSVAMSETSSSKASDPKPRSRRRVISARSFSDHIVDTYSSIDVPTFDTVSGKEWDSRSKAYIRQQLKIMFEDTG